MMNFALKMINSVFKMMNSVLKIGVAGLRQNSPYLERRRVHFVLKMMNSVLKNDGFIATVRGTG